MFERAASWNGWSEQDRLLQLAEHLHEKVLQEWSLGMSLFCFYFHLFFFLAVLLFLAYYAQYFAQS